MIEDQSYSMPFKKWAIIQELKIRGAWISISADLEFLLSKIIIYCDSKNPRFIRKFKKTMLKDKILWAQSELKKHHPTKFYELASCFEKIEELKEIRNQMAHCDISFDPNESNKDRIFIRQFFYDELSQENKLETIEYSLNDLYLEVEKFRNVIKEILNTWIYLVNDFSKGIDGFEVLSEI